MKLWNSLVCFCHYDYNAFSVEEVPIGLIFGEASDLALPHLPGGGPC